METSEPNIGDIRTSYDSVAEQYAKEMGDELMDKPIDRALYSLFAELVSEPEQRGPVADVGCGPGHVTKHLASLGLDILGIDLSPGMIAVARRSFPDLRFEIGSFSDLPAADGAWSGAVAAYSIIHLDRVGRRRAAEELARVVRHDGWLMVAFHTSDADSTMGEVRHHTDWWDHEIDLDFHFLDPSEVIEDLTATGWNVVSRTDREPWPDVEHASRRSYLLARRD